MIVINSSDNDDGVAKKTNKHTDEQHTTTHNNTPTNSNNTNSNNTVTGDSTSTWCEGGGITMHSRL